MIKKLRIREIIKYLFLFFAILILYVIFYDNTTKSYHFNKDLQIIKSDWKGNLMLGDEFVYDSAKIRQNWSGIIKWLFTKNPQKYEKENDTFNVKSSKDLSFLNNTDDVIIWMGHASFFIRLNGINILTDPYYYAGGMRKRKFNIPFRISDIPKVDYVLISHNHMDHANKESLTEIFKNHKNAQILAGLKLENFLKSVTSNYQLAGWYQKYKTDKIKIYFLPARHWSRSGFSDNNKTLWGSFILQTDSLTVFFAGDTGWGNHFKEINKLFPEIDYAVMPVGAYKPDYIVKQNHISPQEALEATKILNAKFFIPMHYGTIDMGDEPLGEPYRYLQQKQSEISDFKILIPQNGEVVKLMCVK